MKSHTSLVAQQTRLSEWAELVRDCQNRPQGMKINEWCQLHDITKASYYWRLRKVREAFLTAADNTPDFIEVPSSAIQSENIAPNHKTAAMIRGRNHLILEITDQACKLRLNGTPVPPLRNGYSVFDGTKYRCGFMS